MKNYTEKKFSEPVKITGIAPYLLTHKFILIKSISLFQWLNNTRDKSNLFNMQGIDNFPFGWQLKHLLNNLLSDVLMD